MQDRGAHAAGHLLRIHIQWTTDVKGGKIFLPVVQTLGGAYSGKWPLTCACVSNPNEAHWLILK